MGQKVLVGERGPVPFLACARVGEKEEQLVQKKIVTQVYLSTAIVRRLLLFTILPAVMCIYRHNRISAQGREPKREMMGETIQVPT